MTDHDTAQASRQGDIEGIRRLARLLDSQFTVPGTSIRFGLDALLGLVPGIGGAAGLVASVVLVAHAVRAGARTSTVARMLAIAGADALLGAVPVLGNVVDVVFKANQRNARIVERQLQDPGATEAESRRVLVGILLAAVVLVALVVVVTVALTVALVRELT